MLCFLFATISSANGTASKQLILDMLSCAVCTLLRSEVPCVLSMCQHQRIPVCLFTFHQMQFLLHRSATKYPLSHSRSARPTHMSNDTTTERRQHFWSMTSLLHSNLSYRLMNSFDRPWRRQRSSRKSGISTTSSGVSQTQTQLHRR